MTNENNESTETVEELAVPTEARNTRRSDLTVTEEIEIELEVKVEELYKYTKDLDKYSGDSCSNYRKFIHQLNTVIKKLGHKQAKMINLDKILKGKVKLSANSRAILTYVIDDSLIDIAAELTTSSRDNNDVISTIKTLSEAWPDESQRTKGVTVRKELLRARYNAGETIQDYNQRYRILFNEAIRLGRYKNDNDAVEDYLSTFPENIGLLNGIIPAISDKEFNSLPPAMDYISKMIKKIKTNGVIVEKKRETIMKTDESKDNKQANRTYANNYKRKIEPLEPGACTSCGNVNCDTKNCPAIGKSCNYCKKPGHLIKACRKLLFRAGHIAYEQKAAVKSVQEPINEEKPDRTFDIQKAIQSVHFVGCIRKPLKNTAKEAKQPLLKHEDKHEETFSYLRRCVNNIAAKQTRPVYSCMRTKDQIDNNIRYSTDYQGRTEEVGEVYDSPGMLRQDKISDVKSRTNQFNELTGQLTSNVVGKH